MSTVEITAGTVEPLQTYARAAVGGALTGSSNLRVQVRRVSDDYFLDFSDATFKAAGWTTRQATLAEVDGTNDPGWYELAAGVNTAGWSTGSYIVTFVEVSTSLAANGPQIATVEIRVVTATPSALSTRLPAALVSGRIDASVGAIASGAIAADAIAADAITAAKIADGAITAAKAPNLDAAVSSRAAPGDAMDLVTDAVDAAAVKSDAVTEIQSGLATASALSSVASAVGSLPSAGDNATAVWGAGARTLTGIGSSGIASQASVDALPTAGGIADAVCDELLSGHTTSGSVGEALGRLDVTVGSRLASASYSAPPSAATIASQVWSTALPGAFTAGSAGYLAGTYLDAAVSTRLATASYSAAPTASAVAAQVWATAEGTPSAGTFGYGLQLLRMGLTNRLEETAGNPGLLKLYADDGTTLLKTWQLRDAASGAVTASSGAPAKRGAAT